MPDKNITSVLIYLISNVFCMGWWYMRQKHLRWFCTLCNGHIPLFLRCFSKLNLSKSLQWEEWSNAASSTDIICYVCTLLFPIDIPVAFQAVTFQSTVVRTCRRRCHNTAFISGCWAELYLWPWWCSLTEPT